MPVHRSKNIKNKLLWKLGNVLQWAAKGWTWRCKIIKCGERVRKCSVFFFPECVWAYKWLPVWSKEDIIGRELHLKNDLTTNQEIYNRFTKTKNKRT